MRKSILVIILSALSSISAQTFCNYTENHSLSNGHICDEDILIFTSSVDTTVKGGISANKEITVLPASSYGITILPADPCTDCTEPTNGSTIGTNKGGGGKGNKQYSNIVEPYQWVDNIIIEKNPVEISLKLSLKNGLIKKIIIFDMSGKTIIAKNNYGEKKVEIDISRLAKGVYGVKTITNNNQTFTKRFIKN